jgi:hypothetical protein
MTWVEIGFDLNETQRAALERVMTAKREKTEKELEQLRRDEKKRGLRPAADKAPRAKTHAVNLESFVYDLFQGKGREWAREVNRIRVVGYIEQMTPPPPPTPGEEYSTTPVRKRIRLEDVAPMRHGVLLPEAERDANYLVVPFPPTPLEWLEWGLGYQTVLNENAGGPARGLPTWETFDAWALQHLLESVATQVSAHDIEAVEKEEEDPYYAELDKRGGSPSSASV